MFYRLVLLKRVKYLKGNLYLVDNIFRLILLFMFKVYFGFLKFKRKECFVFIYRLILWF